MKNAEKKYSSPRKRRCRQEAEREDCFARNRIGNCMALADTDYPCCGCPFYKSGKDFERECRRTYRRLTVLERTDLIVKYEMRDDGLSGSWTKKK